MWRHYTGDWLLTNPAVTADGKIYVANSHDGYLDALRSDGTVIWHTEARSALDAGMTVAPDGTIYVASRDDGIWAFRGTSPLATSQWPKFQHDLRNTGRVGGR